MKARLPVANAAAMSVDTATVRHIAKLARLQMSDAEVEALVPELNNILGWVEQLGEVDTSGVEPMAHAQDLSQRLREDAVSEADRRAAYQAVAPETEAGLYLVPKVIE